MPVVSHSQKRKKWEGKETPIQSPVGLVAVQEDGDGDDGHMGHAQGSGQQHAPPGQVEGAGTEKARRDDRISAKAMVGTTLEG